MPEFVHLHTHSDHSLLDGLGRIPALVRQTRELGMNALALTDHGVMFGAIDFYGAAREVGVNPIVGLEAYVTDGSHRDRSGTTSHLTLMAESDVGYRNLIKLTTTAHLDGFYRKPRVDRDLLTEHADGVICLSGCASGEIARAILDRRIDRAEDVADWYRQVYGDRFYLELQDHGLDFQKTLNEGLLHLHTRTGIPVVATNDVHYVLPEHAAVHEVLLCVQTGVTMADDKRMRMSSREFYLKSPAEMEALFGHVPGALSNTLAIAERTDLRLQFGRLQLPHPPLPSGVCAADHLRALCKMGCQERYGESFTTDVQHPARPRLEYELEIIEKTGYVDYFLLVHDVIRFARESGIAIGVRGSAGGSIVAYALKITNVDPMAHALSFERFLNPERVSMPDVDIDIADDRRDEVIRYVTRTYGRDRVAQIISFGTMASRASVRDVGRALGIPLPQVDRIAKLIPPNVGLREALSSVPELQTLYDDDPGTRSLMDTASELEGVARHASTHAAGVVISADPLTDHVPLYRVPKNGITTTQYAMDPLAKLGLLKMDFLGLRTLTILQRAVELVERVTGVLTPLDSLPLDDPETFALLARGETFGVFQVDGSGMRRLLREMKPDRFDDIVALIALYRPGPMQFIDEFVRRRNGTTPVVYPHPAIKDALENTYGIPVYQEQIVRMVVDIAGFSTGKADILRKAMAKKDPDLMARYRDDFVTGAVSKGTAEDAAQHLFDIIQEFSGYGFPKAHSAAYAVVTCQTAYLKAHYPVPYLAAYLSAERENADKVGEALAECRRLKIAVLLPCVNNSSIDFSLSGDAIRYGLGAIKNVGATAAASIVDERVANGPFLSLGDLCRRLDWRAVNKRTLEALIKCGALDSLGECGQLLVNLDRLVALGARSARDAASGQVSLFGDDQMVALEPQLQPSPPAERRQRLAWEKELIGAYLSEHPLEGAANLLDAIGALPIHEIDATLEGQEIRLGGLITAVRTFSTRRGEPMASVQVTGIEASIEVVVYPRVHAACRDLLTPDTPVVVAGTVGTRNDRVEVRADTVALLDDAESLAMPKYAVSAERRPRTTPLPDPIPFRPRNQAPDDGTASAPRSRGPEAKLVIDFERSEDRGADLQRIEAIYRAILRHPGSDRIVLTVHYAAHARSLALPIDTVDAGPALRADLQRLIPGCLRVERMGA